MNDSIQYTTDVEQARCATSATILHIQQVAEYEDGEANTSWGFMPDCVRVVVGDDVEHFYNAARSLGFRPEVQQDIDNNTPEAKAHREIMNHYAVLS
jgi:hypothetical protein